MTEAQYQQLIAELQRLNANYEALYRKIDQIEDKLLDTILEEWVKLQPSQSDAISELLRNAKKKSS